MSERVLAMAALALHAAMALLTALYMHRRNRHVRAAHILFMALLPVFGPAAGLLLARADGQEPPDSSWMKRNAAIHRDLISVTSFSDKTVPMEEALLINDAGKRRTLMMNMLRSDPKKYMDVLLLARFNEDPETSHYATATLMELQRQMQLDIQRCQSQIEEQPDDADARLRYVDILQEYCASGLIEGQVLDRQRSLLREALQAAIERMPSAELYAMAARNELALECASEAKQLASDMMKRWPHEEKTWLEALRVVVETRDQQGLRMFLQAASRADVDWSTQGREQMKYWMGRSQ